MIIFKHRTLWDNLKRISPAYRKKQDDELREVIRKLVENPDMPCMVGGGFIINGRGEKS